MIDDVQPDLTPWPIDGLVCPSLTLLSGQPKVGKTTLAGHIASSLINGEPLLGKGSLAGDHLIGWMGFDADWRIELANRLKNKARNRITLFDPIRQLDPERWFQFGQVLKSRGVSLLVVDHLYGVAGVLNLNEANNCALVSQALRPIYDELGIPLVLLAQSGKGEYSRGRAAHSVALEAEARCLLRLHDKKAGGHRRLDVSSNVAGEESFSITMSPEGIEQRTVREAVTREVKGRKGIETAKQLLGNDSVEHLLTSWSGTGEALAQLRLSANADAGRSMAQRLRAQGFLREEAGRIVAGDSLLSI